MSTLWLTQIDPVYRTRRTVELQFYVVASRLEKDGRYEVTNQQQSRILKIRKRNNEIRLDGTPILREDLLTKIKELQ